MQQAAYYPFGLEISRDAPASTQAARNGVNRYLYNGVERQPGTEIYQTLFRGLDPLIGRWMQMDPKPDKSKN